MSWGIKIAILYLSFVALIVTLVVLSSRQNIDLEYTDYYNRELRYQDKIDAMANEKGLGESITHQLVTDNLVLSLPSELMNTNVQGELHFYRPSDAKKDVKLPMQFNANGKQIIPRSDFSKGIYKLRMTWTMNNKSYYKELVLNM